MATAQRAVVAPLIDKEDSEPLLTGDLLQMPPSKQVAPPYTIVPTWAAPAVIISLILAVVGAVGSFMYMAGQMSVIRDELQKMEQKEEVNRLKSEQDRQEWQRFMGKLEGQSQKEKEK